MQTNAITQEIRDDHKRILGLLRQLEAITIRTPEMREQVFKQLCMELEVHGQLKDEVFYPVLETLDLTELEGLVEISRDDHRRMLANLDTLKGQLASESSSTWLNAFQNLETEVELHFSREETEILPVADAHLSDRLIELGTWFKSRRGELMGQPEYESAQPMVTQNPNGGEQMRKHGVA